MNKIILKSIKNCLHNLSNRIIIRYIIYSTGDSVYIFNITAYLDDKDNLV